MSTTDAGQRLIAGRYRLRGLIGQGSMGLVWSAYDEHLRRPVAVKEVKLPPGVSEADAAELRERTLREARAIAVLAHPNVVILHDVVREGGEPFVVMEYVQALSLAQVLNLNGACTEVQTAVIGSAVAAGLLAAHAAGITHRDVKPGNVLVGAGGTVKLTDFGIARNVSERTLTRTGVMLGSPAYIAPEVVSGGRVTPAADLWGLGATLFAAVEGRAPYDPDAPVLETLHRVVDGDVPVPSHEGPLRAVITGLMVKDPEARLSLADVRELLYPLHPAPGVSVFAELRTAPVDAATVITAPADPSAGDPSPDTGSDSGAGIPAGSGPRAGSDSGAGSAVGSGAVAGSARASASLGEVSAPLAVVPGPLPFTPPAHAVRTRGAIAAAVLTLVSALLFGGGAAGGFALARVVGGEPVLPQKTTTTPPPTPQAPVTELVVRTADASTLAGEQGGTFAVPVPEDWAKFVENRTAETLPTSTRVHWVAPDGASDIAVERFPEFTGKHTIEDYLAYLKRRAPEFRLVSSTPLGESGMRLTYRTVESAQDVPGGPVPDLTRVTFADVLPLGTDLWLVTLTVPIEQEDTARSGLFAEVAAGFKVTSA